MKQKIVMKVHMHCRKCRTKAMELAACTYGVIMVVVEGDNQDKVVVTGVGIDPVDLAKGMRKKVGHTSILSIEGVMVTGDGIDPVDLAKDIRKKVGHTSILSIGGVMAKGKRRKIAVFSLISKILQHLPK